jgi:hypothetical protein
VDEYLNSITLKSLEWEIQSRVDDATNKKAHTITRDEAGIVVIKTEATKSEVFVLRAKLTLQIANRVDLIEKTAEIRVFVDCESSQTCDDDDDSDSSKDCEDCDPWNIKPVKSDICESASIYPLCYFIDFGECFNLWGGAFEGVHEVTKVDDVSSIWISTTHEVHVAPVGGGHVTFEFHKCPTNTRVSADVTGRWQVVADPTSLVGKKFIPVDTYASSEAIPDIVDDEGQPLQASDWEIGDIITVPCVRGVGIYRIVLIGGADRGWEHVLSSDPISSTLDCAGDQNCSTCGRFSHPDMSVYDAVSDQMYYGTGPGLICDGMLNPVHGCWGVKYSSCDAGWSNPDPPPITGDEEDLETVEVSCVPNDGTATYDLCSVPSESHPIWYAWVEYQVFEETDDSAAYSTLTIKVRNTADPNGAGKIVLDVATWKLASGDYLATWGNTQLRLSDMGCCGKIADATKGPRTVCVRYSFPRSIQGCADTECHEATANIEHLVVTYGGDYPDAPPPLPGSISNKTLHFAIPSTFVPIGPDWHEPDHVEVTLAGSYVHEYCGTHMVGFVLDVHEPQPFYGAQIGSVELDGVTYNILSVVNFVPCQQVDGVYRYNYLALNLVATDVGLAEYIQYRTEGQEPFPTFAPIRVRGCIFVPECVPSWVYADGLSWGNYWCCIHPTLDNGYHDPTEPSVEPTAIDRVFSDDGLALRYTTVNALSNAPPGGELCRVSLRIVSPE